MRFFNDPDNLIKLQRQLVVLTLLILITYSLLQLGVYFADLLRILAMSLLVAYAVINAVDFLEKKLRNRALSIALVYVVLVGIAVVAGFIVIPAMVFQVTSLVTSTVDKLPEFLQQANQALVPLQQRFHEKLPDLKIIDVLSNVISTVPKPDPTAFVNRVSDMAMGTITGVMYMVSISVVTFYFLLDGHRIKEAIIGLFPQKYHSKLHVMAAEMDRSLAAFFKGQIVLGLVMGIVMLIVYVLFQVQYALLLSAFLAICEILPVIGPPIGFFPAIIAVAVHGSALPGARFLQIIILTAVFMVLQQVKDSIVGPKYMGNVIGLHPVMIFIAIMIGARVDGMFGIILALPVASVLSVLVSHLKNGTTQPEEAVVAPVATSAENTQ
ncbi:MAG TPA: AI-2E family transporter [Candidatus Obscuribacterales bacterium]